MSLKARLVRLEQLAIVVSPVMPGLIVVESPDGLTPEQQAAILETEASGQKVILFTVKNAGKQAG